MKPNEILEMLASSGVFLEPTEDGSINVLSNHPISEEQRELVRNNKQRLLEWLDPIEQAYKKCSDRWNKEFDETSDHGEIDLGSLEVACSMRKTFRDLTFPDFEVTQNGIILFLTRVKMCQFTRSSSETLNSSEGKP